MCISMLRFKCYVTPSLHTIGISYHYYEAISSMVEPVQLSAMTQGYL
jgi:hypothetical protein